MSPEVSSRRLTESPEKRRSQTATHLDTPPVTSLRLHVICVVLVLLSAFIFTLTAHDDHQKTLWCVLEIAVQTLIVIGGTVYVRLRIKLLHDSTVIKPALIMAASLSLVCEPVQRLLFGTGHAFEMLIMHSQCNLMMALAVCGFRIAFQRLAVIIAIFMTIFCCTISNARGLIPLTVLFSAATITWLVASWWETVDRRMLESERARLPKAWLAVVVTLPLLMFAIASSFGANTIATALKGFMPSSGGTGDHDPFSRGGVNDGDALIAGNKNIKSFAPLEDAPYVDSDKPSLYDVFNESFDDPVKPSRKQDRAIALPPDMMKHVHQLMAESRQAGREFSLLRGNEKSSRHKIKDLNTHALFYVAGRTPVHLKLEVYEVFDGTRWTATQADQLQDLEFEQVEDRHWLRMPKIPKGMEIFSGTATHSIKVAHLDGNVLPTPAHAVGVNINDVNRADMYRVFENGLVALDRESVPSMTPVNFVSRCVDPEKVRGNSNPLSLIRRREIRSIKDLVITLPEGDDIDEIRELAEGVTEGLPRGWEQFEAITHWLKQNCVLDRGAHASPDCDSPVREFLFETRRGSEYLFASSAAVMLRTLGYPARLVGGFYANPERYDTRKQHTAVHAEDAHFWCEVYVGSDTWLTVEPSPGYEVLGPPPTFIEQFVLLLKLILRAAVANTVLLLLIATGLAVAFINRRHLQDLLLTMRWKWTSRSTARLRAVQLAMLIDNRLRLAGLSRRNETTLRRWAQQPVLEPIREELVLVSELADRGMYSEGDHIGIDVAELDRLAKQLNYRRLLQLRKRPDPELAAQPAT